jgi:hypothetical protein
MMCAQKKAMKMKLRSIITMSRRRRVKEKTDCSTPYGESISRRRQAQDKNVTNETNRVEGKAQAQYQKKKKTMKKGWRSAMIGSKCI